MTTPPQSGTAGPPFGTVLVANRGEIACRIIRTLRRLGIRSVAVFGDADADAPHVRLADVAVRIGAAPAVESYLDPAAIVTAARATGSDAVHPGYGFLSELTGFARACADAGVVFIGPSVTAMTAMADKIAAKELVSARGVPVVPGIGGRGMDDAALVDAADGIGYPLLIKPSAGGGGKGMQIVRTPTALTAGLATARRIATAAFGDDTLLLERLIERPRHIEIQVLADRAGTTVHLGERECSLQRRHQKVIEETPSPLIDDATRARIGEAACEVARSVGYEGAGTVEFLVADAAPDEFFFIEMNTRLQVEHPVTELVTGIDLVEQQLRIAAGEPLAVAQEDVRVSGHAVEARVYAESPSRGFVPATGTVLAFVEPEGDGMRWDGGIAEGSVVGGHYDPMLAKAITHGATRAEAIARLDAMLAGTVLLGVDTNLDELRAVLADPGVLAGRLDTGLLDRRGTPAAAEPDHADLVLAALLVQQARTDTGGGESTPNGGPRVAFAHRSPVFHASADGAGRRSGAWALDGWRAGAEPRATVVRIAGADGAITEVHITGDVTPTGEITDAGAITSVRARVSANGPTHSAALQRGAQPHSWRYRFDDMVELVHGVVGSTAGRSPSTSVWIRRRPESGHLEGARTLDFTAPTRAEHVAAMVAALRFDVARDGLGAAPELRTPMPGTVVAVAGVHGQPVTAGIPLVTVEAMKMEHSLLAPVDGVARISVRVGEFVQRDQVVAVIEPAPADGHDTAPVTDQITRDETSTGETATDETATDETATDKEVA